MNLMNRKNHSKTSLYVAFSVTLLMSLLPLSPVQAQSTVVKFTSQNNFNSKIFILDISNSNNFKVTWNQSLRKSIINILKQPFGFPQDASLINKVGQVPTEIYVSSISANSVDEPLFPIVTKNDSDEMWGMIGTLGKNPSSGRLLQLVDAIFGGQGAFTKQAQKFGKVPLSPLDMSLCTEQTSSTLKKNNYLKSVDPKLISDSSNTICIVSSRITDNLIALDKYFAKPSCGVSTKYCSDVFGALLKANRNANDVAKLYKKGKSENPPSMCIAVASDMLNYGANVTSSPILNTELIVKNSKSEVEATEKGKEAASKVGLNFPTALKVRVEILGQGSGRNPLPLDKNSLLDAYWKGVWDKSGVVSSSNSLDKACSE